MMDDYDWIPTQSDLEEGGLLLFYDPAELERALKEEVEQDKKEQENSEKQDTHEDEGSLPNSPIVEDLTESSEVISETPKQTEQESETPPVVEEEKPKSRPLAQSGRVFFSFEEVPENVTFKSEFGHTIKRLSKNEYLINDRKLYVSQLELISAHKHERKHYGKPEGTHIVYVEKFQELPLDMQKGIMKSGIKLAGQTRREFGIMINIWNFLHKRKDGVAYKLKPTSDENNKHKKNAKFYDEYSIANYDPLVFRVSEMTMTQVDNAEKHFKHSQLSGKGYFGGKTYINKNSGYGRVFFAQHNETGKPVAIKKVDHEHEKEKFQNLKEIGFLTLSRHPSIVNYLFTYQLPTEIWIVMEFMEGGTLDAALRQRCFPEAEVAYIAKELLKGLEFMHYKNLVHRDVTCNNIMLTCQGKVKLIDLGLCADISKGLRKRMAGTPGWMAPEMLKHDVYGTEVDIWSLGVCLVVTAGFSHPFNSFSKLYDVCVNGMGDFFERAPKSWSPLFRDFLKRCLQPDPNQRSTARELLEHAFLKTCALQVDFKSTVESIFLQNVLKQFGLV